MKKFLIGIGVVIVLLLILVIILPFIIDLNRYQAQYLPRIEKALNRKVMLKDIRLMIIPRIGAHLSGLTILEDPAFGTGTFASFSSLDVGVKWRPLLSRRVEVEEITLRDPAVTIIKNPQGVLNISTMTEKAVRKLKTPAPPPSGVPPAGPAASPFQALALLAFDRVSVKDGNIVYRDQSGAKSETKLEKLDLFLKSVGFGKTADLHLAAVAQPMSLPVKSDGTIGPVKENLDLQSINLAISIGKTALNIKGNMQGGNLNLVIAAPVINTADLPMTLPLKKPVQATDLKIAVEADSQRVLLPNYSLNLFGGQITGKAEVDTGSKSLPFSKKIQVQGIQLKQVMEAVGTDKVSVSGTAEANFDMRGAGFSMAELTDSLTGSGHIEAKDGKIEGIDLLEEAFKLLSLAGIRHDITNAAVFSIIESDMSVKHGVITVERSRMDSKDFQATATGTVGFDQKLNLKARLSLSEELSRQVNRSGGNITKAVTTGNRVVVPMIIGGTLSAPVYALDTSAISAKARERVNKEVKEKVRQLFKELENR
jgi:AsmA protein